jgi:hypothetical protein
MVAHGETDSGGSGGFSTGRETKRGPTRPSRARMGHLWEFPRKNRAGLPMVLGPKRYWGSWAAVNSFHKFQIKI